MAQMLRASLDLDYLEFMLQRLKQISFPELNPDFPLHAEVHILLDWPMRIHRGANNPRYQVFTLSPHRFQQKFGTHFSFALTFLLQPARELRDKAEAFLRDHDSNAKLPLLSVHRRAFAWCKPTYKKYHPFCANKSEAWTKLAYFEDDCNVTWTPALQAELRSAWPELFKDNSFTIFLATDLHDLGGDKTFPRTITIPHQENEEHYIAEELIAKRAQGIKVKGFLKEIVLAKTGLDMNWDLSMLVDMWAQVLSQYSIGQPWSSCDRILALWKSTFSRAAFQLYETRGQEELFVVHRKLTKSAAASSTRWRMYPLTCYSGFELPPTPGAATLMAARMRTWWEEHGLLATAPHGEKHSFSRESYEIIPIKVVEWL